MAVGGGQGTAAKHAGGSGGPRGLLPPHHARRSALHVPPACARGGRLAVHRVGVCSTWEGSGAAVRLNRAALGSLMGLRLAPLSGQEAGRSFA